MRLILESLRYVLVKPTWGGQAQDSLSTGSWPGRPSTQSWDAGCWMQLTLWSHKDLSFINMHHLKCLTQHWSWLSQSTITQKLHSMTRVWHHCGYDRFAWGAEKPHSAGEWNGGRTWSDKTQGATSPIHDRCVQNWDLSVNSIGISRWAGRARMFSQLLLRKQFLS